jgi:hypothetical protein
MSIQHEGVGYLNAYSYNDPTIFFKGRRIGPPHQRWEALDPIVRTGKEPGYAISQVVIGDFVRMWTGEDGNYEIKNSIY